MELWGMKIGSEPETIETIRFNKVQIKMGNNRDITLDHNAIQDFSRDL
jgi:hypothetical protein